MNGKKAVMAAAEGNFDLIILDVVQNKTPFRKGGEEGSSAPGSPCAGPADPCVIAHAYGFFAILWVYSAFW